MYNKIKIFLCLILLATSLIYASEKNHYWKLGWGLYGTSGWHGHNKVLDVARFDWSVINFGNEPDDQSTVNFCNKVLALNPEHKFLIRVWPINGLGISENNYMATFLDYLYAPGVKKKILYIIRQQIELIKKGISRPQNIVGAYFLEELPGYFSSCPFTTQWTNWKKGDPVPGDMKPYLNQIEKSMGQPFDWNKPSQRLWWGKKWVDVINQIDKTIKETLGPEGKVFYYQATGWGNLNTLKKGQTIMSPYILPYSYRNILKPVGYADGIFGYPNDKAVWNRKTLAIVHKYHCLFFSQISQPPGMRLSTLSKMVTLARVKNPNNLGGFLFPVSGRKIHAWNELSYQPDNSFWTYSDQIRWFGWKYRINMNVVNRALMPRINLDYNFTGLKKGNFAYVQAFIVNPRQPNWYGGNVNLATLKHVVATLSVPDGLSIPYANNAGPALPLPDIKPLHAGIAGWWVRVDKNDALPGKKRPISVTVVANSDGKIFSQYSLQKLQQEIPSNIDKWRKIYRSGETWVEPAFHLQDETPVVEIQILANKVISPSLISGDRTVVYHGILKKGMTLVIGPENKAHIFFPNLFDKSIRRFGNTDNKIASYNTGYGVYETPQISVNPGDPYKLSITGWKTGDVNSLAGLYFNGMEKGKLITKFEAVLVNSFGPKETLVSAEFVPPSFDKGPVSLRIIFYRFYQKGKNNGTIYYRSFNLQDTAYPKIGLDVSRQLYGVLAPLVSPFSIWTLKDESDPTLYNSAQLRLRFLSPQKVAGKSF
jgi:hypothetical protein